jgi:hypothetical protein
VTWKTRKSTERGQPPGFQQPQAMAAATNLQCRPCGKVRASQRGICVQSRSHGCRLGKEALLLCNFVALVLGWVCSTKRAEGGQRLGVGQHDDCRLQRYAAYSGHGRNMV